MCYGYLDGIYTQKKKIILHIFFPFQLDGIYAPARLLTGNCEK